MNLFPFPNVIIDIIFNFYNPFKESHERNQEPINRCFNIYQKKRHFDVISLEINRYHNFRETDLEYPKASSIADLSFIKHINEQSNNM